jgi:hypothetical protein
MVITPTYGPSPLTELNKLEKEKHKIPKQNATRDIFSRRRIRKCSKSYSITVYAIRK